MIRRRSTASIVHLSWLLLLAPALFAAKSPAQFIWLSDVHFDPTANPKLVDSLAGASVDQWPHIFTTNAPGRLSRYAEDTNWALFSSSLAAIRKVAPNARFTVVTGDIFVHSFREKFNAAATDHNEKAFRSFARKTLQFIAAQLATAAPGKPVLLTLGNNDSECGDYQVEPGGPFLKDSSGAVARLLGALADDQGNRDWTALSSYSVAHPYLKNYRVIALNSVFFSPRYRNGCSASATDPAAQQMSWLARELAAAKARKQRVWLIFHIPPGIDGYATSHPKGGGSPKIVGMWKPAYTEQFESLLAQYRDTVAISLAGHEHTDDVRLLRHSLVLMTPGLSPVVRQNPAFRVVDLESNGTLSDETTYYLSNLDAVQQGAAPEWQEEYGFAKAWGVHPLSLKNFRKLYREVERNPEIRDRWSNFYSVSHPAGGNITRQTFRWLFCASGNLTEANYQACVDRN